MNLPEPSREKLRTPRASKSSLVLMLIIVASMALVAIFANIQRLRRSQVETVVVRSATPLPSPLPSQPR
jgi:cell division septal protein FtsQ